MWNDLPYTVFDTETILFFPVEPGLLVLRIIMFAHYELYKNNRLPSCSLGQLPEFTGNLESRKGDRCFGTVSTMNCNIIKFHWITSWLASEWKLKIRSCTRQRAVHAVLWSHIGTLNYAPPRCRTLQYIRTLIPFSVSLWNDLANPVFDDVGLAGFKSRANASLLA